MLESYNLLPPQCREKGADDFAERSVTRCDIVRNFDGGVPASPERRAASYERFHWCDCCGTRFEIYLPSVAMPWRTRRAGLGIL